MKLIQHFKNFDWILTTAALFLAGIGLLSLYSFSLSKGVFLNFEKQIVFVVIGFFLMVFLSFFDWRALRENHYLILILYFMCLLGLLGLFFIAPEIRGVKGWYKIGILSLNPIEPTKIVLIILLAKYFSMRHIEMYRVRHIFFRTVCIFAGCVDFPSAGFGLGFDFDCLMAGHFDHFRDKTSALFNFNYNFSSNFRVCLVLSAQRLSEGKGN